MIALLSSRSLRSKSFGALEARFWPALWGLSDRPHPSVGRPASRIKEEANADGGRALGRRPTASRARASARSRIAASGTVANARLFSRAKREGVAA
jgi:hypothetical protein